MSSAFTSTVTCRDQSLYTPYTFSQLHKLNCKYLILTPASSRICKAASQLKCRAMRAQPSITGCRCACGCCPWHRNCPTLSSALPRPGLLLLRMAAGLGTPTCSCSSANDDRGAVLFAQKLMN